MSWVFIIFLVFLAVLVVSSFFRAAVGYGAELLVPSDYATIQDAITAAGTGDTVTVASGTYTGDGNRDLDFVGKAITVRSANGAAVCIIDCEGNDSDPHQGFYFGNGEGADSVLDGFTITGGYGERGGAIYCWETSPTIRNCILRENTAYNYGGAMCLDQSVSTISGCVIEDNRTSRDDGGNSNGGGLFLTNFSDVTITDCVIRDNTAGNYGGGIQASSSSPLIVNSIISGNRTLNYSGAGYNGTGQGISLRTSFVNCLISGNLTEAPNTNGGGVAVNWPSSTEFINCTVVGNFGNRGGGISGQWDCQLWVTNCILWNNRGGFGSQLRLEGTVDAPTWVSVEYTNMEGGESGVSVGAGSTLVWGEGNIENNPLFLTAGYWDDNGTPLDEEDDFWVEGNYSLAIDSLCIDAGDPNFIAEPGDTDLTGRDKVINGIVDMGAHESGYRDIHLTKMTYKAGKTRDAEADSFSFRGDFVDADADDFTSADTVTVWVGTYSEEIPVADFKQKGKKPKYNYKGGKEGITSVKLDFTKNTFRVSAKNVDLSGLTAPISVVIEFGGHVGLGLAQDEGRGRYHQRQEVPANAISLGEHERSAGGQSRL